MNLKLDCQAVTDGHEPAAAVATLVHILNTKHFLHLIVPKVVQCKLSIPHKKPLDVFGSNKQHFSSLHVMTIKFPTFFGPFEMMSPAKFRL